VNLSKNTESGVVNNNYYTFVKQNFKKASNLIKLLNMPLENFNESLKAFFPDISLQETEKIQILKGLKKDTNQKLFNFV
jgi:hypothetical protein